MNKLRRKSQYASRKRLKAGGWKSANPIELMRWANRIGACDTFHLGRLCRPESAKRSRLSLAPDLFGAKERAATVLILV